MNENRSTIYTTTLSSSIYKKKEEKPLGFSSPDKHLVSLCNKSGIMSKVLNTPTTGVSPPDDSFLLSSNKFEMNKEIIPKVESISYAKGYRTHLKKVARSCMSLEDYQ
tara:strand:- start:201 stop:524 length:324 start_codon:yes stop_codon:yes gene_type:complete